MSEWKIMGQIVYCWVKWSFTKQCYTQVLVMVTYNLYQRLKWLE